MIPVHSSLDNFIRGRWTSSCCFLKYISICNCAHSFIDFLCDRWYDGYQLFDKFIWMMEVTQQGMRRNTRVITVSFPPLDNCLKQCNILLLLFVISKLLLVNFLSQLAEPYGINKYKYWCYCLKSSEVYNKLILS